MKKHNQYKQHEITLDSELREHMWENGRARGGMSGRWAKGPSGPSLVQLTSSRVPGSGWGQHVFWGAWAKWGPGEGTQQEKK